MCLDLTKSIYCHLKSTISTTENAGVNMPDEQQASTSESADGGGNGNSAQVGNCGICCRFASVALLVIVLVVGVMLVVVANAKTDEHAAKIDRQVSMYVYLTVVHAIAIVWMFMSMFIGKYFENGQTTELVPTRLLVGVMIFGLGSSFMSMIEILQYLDEHENSDDVIMPIYNGVRTLFVYVQLYFFYKLSKSPVRVSCLPRCLFMHLIAVNMATWIVAFVHEITEELHEGSKLEDMHVGNGTIHNSTMLPARVNETESHENGETLELVAENMKPYLFTFTLEYCLISAGLLLNAWRSLDINQAVTTSQEGGGDVTNLKGEEQVNLWRFGFIGGLVYIPAFFAIVLNMLFSDDKEEDQIIYLSMELFFFLSLFIASLIGFTYIENPPEKSHSQVDVTLLGAALSGVIFLDVLIIVASSCEWEKSPAVAPCLILTNFMELLSSAMFAYFVQKAFQIDISNPGEGNKGPGKENKGPGKGNKGPGEGDKDPGKGNKDPGKGNKGPGKGNKGPGKENKDPGKGNKDSEILRHVVSFLFVLNICFWALYTFEVKKSHEILDIVEQFYTEKVWFYLSRFAYPLAVFFHFHGAVCMVEILKYTVPKSRTD